MTRSLLILRNDDVRNRAIEFIRKAPEGTRLEFKAERRTSMQNDRMWAMLTDIAKQAHHCGRRFTTDEWKVLFMHALGKEVAFLPALDGHSFVPYGQRNCSSDAHRKIRRNEQTWIGFMTFSWDLAAENGVRFHDAQDRSGIADMARSEFSKTTKRAALARAMNHCEASGFLYGLPATAACGVNLAHGVEFDHVLADSNGGDASLGNCLAVCVKCHKYKTAKHDTPRAAKGLRQQDKARGIKRKHNWGKRSMTRPRYDNTKYLDRT